MIYDVYVFDAFGTLIKPVNKVKEILRNEKISISKDISTIIMTTPKSVISIIEKHITLTNTQKHAIEQALSQEIQDGELYDDVVITLEKIHKLNKQIHLISNLGYEYALLVHKLLDKYIVPENIHLSCYRGARKPDPKIYDIGANYNQKVIMIGDSIKNDYFGPISIGRDAKIIDRDNKIEHTDKITNLYEIFNEI